MTDPAIKDLGPDSGGLDQADLDKHGERFCCIECGRNGFRVLAKRRPGSCVACPECGGVIYLWPAGEAMPAPVRATHHLGEQARCSRCRGTGRELFAMDWGPCGGCVVFHETG